MKKALCLVLACLFVFGCSKTEPKQNNQEKETIQEKYTNYQTVLLNLHNKERKSKTPFLKWYVNGHSNRSLLCKFIEAFITKNTDKLNKNHKVLYNTCIITLK